LLDEPTNSLDPESIDALAKAINEFEGGMVLVSHDMRLISQVAKEIWICDNKTIAPYKGDILSFKLAMRAQMGLDDGAKQAPKALRGDASLKVKENVGTKKISDKTSKPKLPKIVAPKSDSTTMEPSRTVATTETKPSSSSAAPKYDNKDIEDAVTVASTVTASSSSGMETTKPTSVTNGGPAPPEKVRYIPPHLRKKMMEEQQSLK
jgi:energy-coupling factor transporter ATP-binding protein EcfA2